jgi:DUF438 domain-containing protein
MLVFLRKRLRKSSNKSLKGVSSLEIAKIEQELIEEGISREEIQRLCDVHLAIFREQLQKQQVETAPENPISILREEHKMLFNSLLGKTCTLVEKFKKPKI